MSWFKNTWFRDPDENILFINDTAVRIRAGMMLVIPLFMALTLFDVLYTSPWIVNETTIEDTYEITEASQIIYSGEMVKRSYDFSVQTLLLFYGLFELIAGMFVWTARFSPSIQLASFLARNKPPVWKPLTPKRFAWGLGIALASFCLVFFNPDVFAGAINTLFSSELLPTTYNYIPYQIPVTLIWVCLALMWFEAVLGFCLGCKIHSLLVWMGVITEPCYACNNIDWDAIKRKHEAA
ncbi:DUF4395 family protein [Thiomicrorhabdus heinhorstiae]|uniref:DUF4395 family protein n=1 Tax=Thiomicrorhabdus heinhorstiae TaxID=2748010 RepID=A0ABS0BYK0_9GAMM|nr:DUF4395 family protein [Thiomicrorhabdus heinhorstiae]MBF6058873.1 DUF4395 family protein [Thiomicrorhabdus heinhorstiae]